MSHHTETPIKINYFKNEMQVWELKNIVSKWRICMRNAIINKNKMERESMPLEIEATEIIWFVAQKEKGRKEEQTTRGILIRVWKREELKKENYSKKKRSNIFQIWHKCLIYTSKKLTCNLWRLHCKSSRPGDGIVENLKGKDK